MSEAKSTPKKPKEPFPGAYYLAGAITLALMLLFMVLGATLPPGAAGFLVAFVLGLTVNPKYVPFFFVAGVFSAVMGFWGQEPQVAWGGVALALSQVLVKRLNRTG
ncbi:hypothetical protein [Thermus tengchongensis]|uniref:Uncharacterized protein n=1 Tax=Thermus tengchongensis TaxID=1214928 RepID=A0A4Y9FFN7_9DEIN|nr:hypothetical protein [Thermus tengchongensis]TFU17021.1 hypothetical protein E0489_03190 [Thermus tengchongensis]TFU27319.1 hypothetical protein E0687_02905 [Thermus tengchongensis]